MFDTDALRLIDAVARLGSFTAAAVELQYTQSAVSRRVAALEVRAGGPLFERLPRGVRLTPAGATLHRHTRDVLERLQRAGEELAAIHRGTGGRLRVGAFATANAALVPAALKDYRAEFPDVDTTLIEGMTGHLVEQLDLGAIDVAVVSDYPAGLEAPPSIALEPLLEEEFLVGLPADHRLASQQVIDLRDLRDDNWIEGARPGQGLMLAAACAAAGFTPRVGMRVGEWTGKLGFVAAGLGVTLVPALATQGMRPDLVLRPIARQAPRRTVFAALPRVALPAARELARVLAGAAGRMAGCTTPSPTSRAVWPPA
ncbi:LysR family transcriptional regulator [Herbidospora mongoliensis]|uniref:LysR family transcriptional regulator n=1 Tax=Herbidospora mongoliensis TaxID=688067 RepID=UPI00082BF691|nr:LysR family transcriptional regulator [Herbidospora mongoliensis]